MYSVKVIPSTVDECQDPNHSTLVDIVETVHNSTLKVVFIKLSVTKILW